MANKVIQFSQSSLAKKIEDNVKEVFLDINMQSKQQGNKCTIDKLVNVNAIKNSLHNIFSWTPGERILNPEFGSKLRKLLYEGITDFNQEQIIAEIRNSVSQWELRVRIDDIVKLTSTDDVENNTVYLRVIYSIPSLTKEQFYYDYSTGTSN